MMGREVNFRPSDVSSAFNDNDPSRYIKRLFGPGDEKVPEMIQQENPILHFAVHNLLSYSEPIWQALGDRCVFIEIVRHPLYMVRQQALNMRHLLEDVRDFIGHSLQYFTTHHDLVDRQKESRVKKAGMRNRDTQWGEDLASVTKSLTTNE